MVSLSAPALPPLPVASETSPAASMQVQIRLSRGSAVDVKVDEMMPCKAMHWYLWEGNKAAAQTSRHCITLFPVFPCSHMQTKALQSTAKYTQMKSLADPWKDTVILVISYCKAEA